MDAKQANQVKPVQVQCQDGDIEIFPGANSRFRLKDGLDGRPRIALRHVRHRIPSRLPSFVQILLGLIPLILVEMQAAHGVAVSPRLDGEGSG